MKLRRKLGAMKLTMAYLFVQEIYEHLIVYMLYFQNMIYNIIITDEQTDWRTNWVKKIYALWSRDIISLTLKRGDSLSIIVSLIIRLTDKQTRGIFSLNVDLLLNSKNNVKLCYNINMSMFSFNNSNFLKTKISVSNFYFLWFFPSDFDEQMSRCLLTFPSPVFAHFFVLCPFIERWRKRFIVPVLQIVIHHIFFILTIFLL